MDLLFLHFAARDALVRWWPDQPTEAGTATPVPFRR